LRKYLTNFEKQTFQIYEQLENSNVAAQGVVQGNGLPCGPGLNFLPHEAAWPRQIGPGKYLAASQWSRRASTPIKLMKLKK